MSPAEFITPPKFSPVGRNGDAQMTILTPYPAHGKRDGQVSSDFVSRKG